MTDKREDRTKALKFLKSRCLMALATSSPDGSPRASTMLYVVDDDFSVCFITRKDTKKAAHLAANPRVGISVGTSDPINVQAEGRATLIEDESKRVALFARLAEAGGSIADFWPPILRIEAGDYLLYRVVPDWLRVLDLEDGHINEMEMPFVEIIP